MTTTSDHAELSRRLGALVYHILQTGTADSQDAQTCFEAAEAIRTLLERNTALERERDRFEAKKISLQDDVIPGLIYRAETAETERDELAAENERLRQMLKSEIKCDPHTIRELLAERDALAAEVKRVRGGNRYTYLECVAASRKPVKPTSKTLKQIFRLMKLYGVTQEDMARGLNIDKEQMQKYKNGHEIPSILQVEEMADLLEYELAVQSKWLYD